MEDGVNIDLSSPAEPRAWYKNVNSSGVVPRAILFMILPTLILS